MFPIPQSFVAREGNGRDRWEEWTPIRVGWTDVGTPVVAGRYRVVGAQCFCQVRVTPGTTCETTAGTSYIECPIAAAGYAGGGTMGLDPSTAVGQVKVDVANSRAYLPSQTATASVISIEWSQEV